MGGTNMIFNLLIIASIITLILFLSWYADRQTNKKIVRQWVEKCQIDRYEKSYYEELKIWEIKDRLNNKNPIVGVYGLPEDIAEEIMDYSLKLIEDGEMK